MNDCEKYIFLYIEMYDGLIILIHWFMPQTQV